METRSKVIIALCIAVAIVLLIIGVVNRDNIYCVENNPDYECGDCLDYFACECGGGTLAFCYDLSGVACSTDCLECSWYPFFCGMQDCAPVICGFNFCHGSTDEFGNEYDTSSSVKIVDAELNVDYYIDKIVVSQNDEYIADVYDEFDWTEFWNTYLQIHYDDEFTVAVYFTTEVPLYYASTIVRVTDGEDGIGGSTYFGHPASLVREGSYRKGYVIQPGTYVTSATTTLSIFESMQLGDLMLTWEFSAKKIVEVNGQ